MPEQESGLMRGFQLGVNLLGLLISGVATLGVQRILTKRGARTAKR